MNNDVDISEIIGMVIVLFAVAFTIFNFISTILKGQHTLKQSQSKEPYKEVPIEEEEREEEREKGEKRGKK